MLQFTNMLIFAKGGTGGGHRLHQYQYCYVEADSF